MYVCVCKSVGVRVCIYMLQRSRKLRITQDKSVFRVKCWFPRLAAIHRAAASVKAASTEGGIARANYVAPGAASTAGKVEKRIRTFSYFDGSNICRASDVRPLKRPICPDTRLHVRANFPTTFCRCPAVRSCSTPCGRMWRIRCDSTSRSGAQCDVVSARCSLTPSHFFSRKNRGEISIAR